MEKYFCSWSLLVSLLPACHWASSASGDPNLPTPQFPRPPHKVQGVTYNEQRAKINLYLLPHPTHPHTPPCCCLCQMFSHSEERISRPLWSQASRVHHPRPRGCLLSGLQPQGSWSRWRPGSMPRWLCPTLPLPREAEVMVGCMQTWTGLRPPTRPPGTPAQEADGSDQALRKRMRVHIKSFQKNENFHFQRDCQPFPGSHMPAVAMRPR